MQDLTSAGTELQVGPDWSCHCVLDQIIKKKKITAQHTKINVIL